MPRTPIRQIVAATGVTLTLVAFPAVADEEKTTGEPAAISDPLEGLNRFTSGLNDFIRGLVIDPVVDVYQGVTPEPVQGAISNAARNLAEPVTAGASLLQGDTENAKKATQRFLINTTAGIGGLSDQAKEMGIESRQEDLGQALGKHGVAPGPHIVLPVIGPSNLRDATGDIATMFASPLPLAAGVAGGAVKYSDNQDDIHALRDGSIDPYTTEKEAYERYREAQIRNGDPGPAPVIEFAETNENEAGSATK